MGQKHFFLTACVLLFCGIGCADTANTTPNSAFEVTNTPGQSAELSATLQVSSSPTQLRATWTIRPTQPTSTITVTPSITPRPPTPTSPPVPPLSSHAWEPEKVLISFGHTGGDGGNDFDNPPTLTLLGNGMLYEYRYSQELDGLRLYEAQLTEQKVCQLINTIDQTGFLQYDENVVDRNQMGDGAPDTYILIHAWRDKEIWFPSLPFFIEGDLINYEYYIPPILPALSSTYKLLKSYEPNNLQLSSRQTLALFVEEVRRSNKATPWPKNVFSLGDFFDNSNCKNLAIKKFIGPEVVKILALFPFENWGVFEENGRFFSVEEKSIYPEESFPACDAYSFRPPVLEVTLPNSYSCTPEDGVRQIPP
jgi:hypothetical protein